MQACQGPCEAAEGTFQEEPSLIPQVWQSIITLMHMLRLGWTMPLHMSKSVGHRRQLKRQCEAQHADIQAPYFSSVLQSNPTI